MGVAPDAPEAQREVIAFLSRPEAYGPEAVEVQRIDTHGAVVFLAGTRAYKLKRAVRFPYMDYSTRARRRAMCEAELAINRRTAPMLYEAVVPVTRAGAGLRIGGDGEAVDWLVVMRRFDQSALLDRVAARGGLTAELMAALADEIADFHRRAENRAAFGGAEGIAWVIDGNREGLAAAGPELFAPDAVGEFDSRCRAVLARIAERLEARRRAGFVRHCHGDLHLRNICLIDGRPVLFDAIEFNDRIACIDTMYDFAFLMMDLERRGLRSLANVAFNAYLAANADYGSLVALPLFLACRAGVSAHTIAAAARAQPEAQKRRALAAEAGAGLAFAHGFLAPPPARLVAIGGLSGTGKSTLARLVAPELGCAPGAVVLRTDLIRKRLAGVAPTVRLDPAAYSREASAKVYAALVETARDVARAGHAVIADAVFAAPNERAAIAAAAAAAGVPFTGIWLDASPEQLAARIEGRRGDASDATVEVLRRQLTYDLGTVDWQRIDAGAAPAAVADRIRAALHAR